MARSALASALRPFPLRRQLESSDCGAACLQMLCAFHGLQWPLAALRELAQVQAGGTSLLDLAAAAQKLGFQARGVQVEDASALAGPEGRGMLPAIAHWSGNHFVVLYRVTARHAVVGDPATGLRRLTHAELAEHWDGVLLLLEPTGALRAPSAEELRRAGTHRAPTWSHYLKDLWRYRVLLGQVLLASLLLQGLGLLKPLLIQGLMDGGVHGRAPELLLRAGLGLLVLLAAQVAATAARGAGLFLLSSTYSTLLLSRFWARLLSLPVPFFARRDRGDLLRRIEDHQQVRRVLQSAAPTVLLDALMLVGAAALLFTYDPGVFVGFVLGCVLYAGWTLALLPRRARLDTERFQVAAETSRLELQMLGGILTLKACGAERLMRARWERLQVRDFAVQRRLWRLDTLHQAGTTLVGQGMYLGILLYEAWRVMEGALTVGQMVATLSLLGLVMAPLHSLAFVSNSLQDVILSLRRVGVVHAARAEEVGGAEEEVPLLQRAPELRVEHLTFRYGGAHTPPVLADVSFTAPAGKMTAIVGRSGAGKTTLIHLLYGLHSPEQGRVLYDEQPLASLPPAGLRRSVGYVLQKTDIFDGTLAENIALGDASPDEERLLHAARAACLHELLALPLGLQTRIGEAGMRLSGGEEQRLQLARALYRDPRVLFLDEATSHLDATLERAITEALQREAAGRTLVVVAHRLSTVRRADHIVVVDKGRVVEQGTHDTLVAIAGGHYRALVENQMEA